LLLLSLVLPLLLFLLQYFSGEDFHTQLLLYLPAVAVIFFG